MFNVYSHYYKNYATNFPTTWCSPNPDVPIVVRPTGSIISNVASNNRYSIRTTKPFTIREDCKEFYFEILLTSCPKDSVVTIGFTTLSVLPANTLPGWVKGSWALHSDDGNLFNENGKSGFKDLKTKIDVGDTVGCGINSNLNLYFTKNGILLDPTTLKFNIGTQYFPILGFDGSSTVTTNLGNNTFLYKTIFFESFEKQNTLKKNFSCSERFNTYITTDKPIYKPGEILYFRGWILHTHTQKPISNDMANLQFKDIAAEFKVIDPSGSEKTVINLGVPNNGVICGSYKIPDDTPGGDYRITIKYWKEGFTPSERKFNIRSFGAPPRLKIQLEFPTKGYGPGDNALAKLSVNRAEGGVPNNAVVTSVARINGVEVFRSEDKLDKDGKLEIKFKIPLHITGGEGTLTCTVNDEGTIESKGQTIPILLQNIDISFYPEGGELVGNLECGLYIEAKTPTGDPADLMGEILTESYGYSRTIIQTSHEGRGRCSFNPIYGEKYYLRVMQPSGINRKIPLPEVKKEGVSLRSLKSVFEYNEPLSLSVGATLVGVYRLSVYKRDLELACVHIDINWNNESKEVPVHLSNQPSTIGVLRVTVFDEKGNPMAERLIFRKPKGWLRLEVESNKLSYSPGDQVVLDVKAYDEEGLPVSAFVGICVTDDAVLEMVDKRLQVPRLPSMAFFEDNVEHLEDADVYLDPNNSLADFQLDLLLGTQGWRKFAFVDPFSFIEKMNEKLGIVERLLGIHNGEKPPSIEIPPIPETIIYDGYQEENELDSLIQPEIKSTKPRSLVPSPQTRSKRVIPAVRTAVPSVRTATPAVRTAIPVVNKSIPSARKAIPSVKSKSEKKSKKIKMKRKVNEEDFLDSLLNEISPISAPPTSSVPIITRVYAHKNQKIPGSTDRSDFTETIYWNASYKTRTFSIGNNFNWKLNIKEDNIEIIDNNIEIKNNLSYWYNIIGNSDIGIVENVTLKFLGTIRPVCFGVTTNENIEKKMIGQTYNSWGLYINNPNFTKYISKSSYYYTNINFKIGDEITMSYKNGSISYIINGIDCGVAFNSIPSNALPAISVINSTKFSLETKENNLLKFDASDSVTSFKVWVEGVTDDGLLGYTSSFIVSKNPFYMDYKLPIQVSSRDKIIIPVSLVNETDKQLSVSIKGKTDARALKLPIKSKDEELIELVNVPSYGRARSNIQTDVLRVESLMVDVTLSAFTSLLTDTVTRSTHVLPIGFPYQLNTSGMIPVNGSVKRKFDIPSDVDPESISVEGFIFLSPVGNMTSALAGLVRKPYGCFEQTSSTAYPMVMAQQYFLSHQITKQTEPIIKNAKEHIAYSYQRLTGFEVKVNGKPSGGFDWFGNKPANESLTAYGLLEFNDMSQVHSLDSNLIPRVRDWLLSRRSGDGTFKKESYYQWGGAHAEITNMYICWALSGSGVKPEELTKEIQKNIEVGEKSRKKDPYFLALLSLTLRNFKRDEEADIYGYRLTELQAADGSVIGDFKLNLHDSRFQTVVCGFGRAAAIDATSLAIVTWLKGGEKFLKFWESAMNWLSSQCKDGCFGSTQGTILGIKAINEYDKYKSVQDAGDITILINGKNVGKLSFDPKTSNVGKLVMPSYAKELVKGGSYEIEIKQVGGSKVPFAVTINYNAIKPDNHPDCVVHLSTKLSTTEIKEGEGTEIQVELTNLEKERGQPMTMVVIGLPGGLEPRHEQLRDLVKSKTISYYEIYGREVAIYFIELQPAQKINFKVDVVAKIPGSYTGPASRSYLYYTDEEKYWCTPLVVNILPQNQ